MVQNEELKNFLLDFSVGKSMVLMGDFNLPSLCWNSNRVSDVRMTPLNSSFF